MDAKTKQSLYNRLQIIKHKIRDRAIDMPTLAMINMRLKTKDNQVGGGNASVRDTEKNGHEINETIIEV